MCKYLDKDGAFKGITEVPDPYYGGTKGFELVSIWSPDACTADDFPTESIPNKFAALTVWPAKDFAGHCHRWLFCSAHVNSRCLWQVLDLLDDACKGLLAHIRKRDVAKVDAS